MQKILFTLLFITAASFAGYGQDLNGIWKGVLQQESGGCFNQYNIELQVKFIPTANTLSGIAYDFEDPATYVKMDFSGRYNSTTKRMVLIENNLLESKIPNGCFPCIKTYDLVWSKNGSEDVLTGSCKGREYGSANNCPGYKIELKKASRTDFPIDIEQTPELAALQQSIKLKPRQNEVVHTVKSDTSLIKIDLYDNAEIDNDTVTVFVNNKLLLYKQRLTDKALTVLFNAFPATNYELMMYADNLGAIPPNTALLVVTAGTKKYELRVSSSEQKNAVVRFRYDK